jgi:hypothetical protein
MAACTESYTQEAYILKLDIRGYFMSINRQLLYDKLEKTLQHFRHKPVAPVRCHPEPVEGFKRGQSGEIHAQCFDKLSMTAREQPTPETWDDRLDYDLVLYLLRIIVFTDPVEGCLVKGSRKEWEGLPPSKSLFNQPKGVGLPIGNLTSQLFSNVYLNRFDHWVVKELGCPYYGRYVDDFYIVHRSVAYLKELLPKIKEFLKSELGLTLHPNKVYLQNVRHGCSFLGAVIKEQQRFAGKRLRSHFKVAAAACASKAADEQQVVVRMNSYLGLLKHYPTYKLRQKIVERLNKDGKYVVGKGYLKIKKKNG